MQTPNKIYLPFVAVFMAMSLIAISQQNQTKKATVPSKPKSKTSTKPSAIAKRRVPRITSLADRPAPPFAPDILAAESDVIVTGKVIKVLAVRPTPIDCTDPEGWMGNHTVYAFQVEKYFKGSGGNTLKIHNDGGIANGVEYFQEDNPGLIVGERYFLFLKSYANDPRVKKLGFLPCSVGRKTYKLGDSDELFPAHIQRGKIRIENGVLVQATDEDHSLGRWRFEGRGSDQLIGVTEQEAHAIILKAVKDSIGMGKSVIYSDAPP